MNAELPMGKTATPATKRAWRRSIVASILSLDPADRHRQEAALAEALVTLPGWESAETVLLYVKAFPEEIATEPLLARAHASGKRVVLPRVDRVERRLRLHQMTDPGQPLVPGVLGIPEPDPTWPEVVATTIDWVLVPGIAFDEQGNRLGRGAGHYDRLLPQIRPEAVRWALCLSCQLVPALPVEPHDIPLDGITTADRTVRGRQRPAFS